MSTLCHIALMILAFEAIALVACIALPALPFIVAGIIILAAREFSMRRCGIPRGLGLALLLLLVAPPAFAAHARPHGIFMPIPRDPCGPVMKTAALPDGRDVCAVNGSYMYFRTYEDEARDGDHCSTYEWRPLPRVPFTDRSP